MDFFSPCVWYAQRCSLKSATIIHVYQFFMQWYIIHKSVIHIWKQNFRIYIDALNINYVFRNSLVLIFFLPLLDFLSWSHSLFLSHPPQHVFLFVRRYASLFVCLSASLSVYLLVCLSSLLSFLWSWYFVVKSLRLMQMSKYFLFLKISKITAFAVAKESFGVVQRE